MAEQPTSSTGQVAPRRMGLGGGPPMGMRGVVEKPKDLKGTLKQLAKYLRPFRLKIALVIVFAVMSTVFAIVGPKILGHATNTIVDDYVSIKTYNTVIGRLPSGVKLPAGTTGATLLAQMPASVKDNIPAAQRTTIQKLDFSKRPTFHFHDIAMIISLLIVLFLLSAIFTYIQGWIMSGVTQQVTYRFRRDISEKINRLPLSYFDKRTYGEILSRVTNDIDTVSQTLNQSLSQIITSVVMIVGIIAMMFSISWLLTVITLLILPLSFIGIMFITKRSQKQFVRQQTELGHLNGHVEEMYAGHQVMRVFNGGHASIEKFRRINNRLHGSAWRAQFLSGLMFPITTFIGNLGYVGVAVAGGWLAINGHIRIGDIQAFIQYVQQFNQPILQTANIANVVQSTAAAAERVFEFLGEPEQSPESEKAATLSDAHGHIVFDHVKFSYTPDRPIIKDLSLDIQPGHRIAIVGPTGAGKTTLVNLLMRFYDVDSGSITIDGVDIREMHRSDVRKMFGMVLQDAWLFNGTIRDNLLYARPDANEKTMLKAARDAHVDHFVHSLPGGYDMPLNEEASNVSQGEKQLLTIARAMLAEAPMLILDEATSSVDTRTEVLIQKAMDTLLEGKTSFVIAHRLSTIRDADLILVMNEGDVIERGNHKALMAQDGFYASLYNSQFTLGDIE